MGRVVTFLTILIFIDLLFITTGQVTQNISSIFLNALLNLGEVDTTQFFIQLIGNVFTFFTGSGTGIAALVASGGVLVGAFFATKSDTVLFIPITFTLALLATDLIVIAQYLLGLNIFLATFIMGPITLIYILSVIEWLRGKD